MATSQSVLCSITLMFLCWMASSGVARAGGEAEADLKKGVGVNGRHLVESVDALGCAWYYNWGPLPHPDDGKAAHAEFIPMIWNGRNLDASLKAAQSTGSKYLLGFNEPDGKDQANLNALR